MESKQEFLENILEINPKYNIKLLGRAYDVAEQMHNGQLRKSGEPYLIHPLAVVKILAQLGMDDNTLVSGLLHDVVEDTEYTKEQLTKKFEEEIAGQVDSRLLHRNRLSRFVGRVLLLAVNENEGEDERDRDGDCDADELEREVTDRDERRQRNQ